MLPCGVRDRIGGIGSSNWSAYQPHVASQYTLIGSSGDTSGKISLASLAFISRPAYNFSLERSCDARTTSATCQYCHQPRHHTTHEGQQ